MKTIAIAPDVIIDNLLSASRDIGLCLLDSCGSDHSRSKMLIAGVYPVGTCELRENDAAKNLSDFDRLLTGDKPAIFSLSYDLGRRIHGLPPITGEKQIEPEIFMSVFDTLLIHDYSENKTFVAGDPGRSEEISKVLRRRSAIFVDPTVNVEAFNASLSKIDYIRAIESIKEHIRAGNTYQTNLTQQLTAKIPKSLSPATMFQRIRRHHPAPFAAFLERERSTVISASPERFFKVEGDRIFASPIKGTRRRGLDLTEDNRLKVELLQSAKDRAENIMIVDLLRNDLGRICKYGSVFVNELCAVQELPTLFHLESTIEGRLQPSIRPSQMIEALFPCGSITGAPKLRTMQIIDELEPTPRGLSMGAIGIYIPDGFGIPPMFDLSVAIRTMVIRDGLAIFNVGGGVVIDSEPENEYEESLIKARSLLKALGIADVYKKVV